MSIYCQYQKSLVVIITEGYVAMSPVRMKVPVDLLCPSNKELSLHDEQSGIDIIMCLFKFQLLHNLFFQTVK